MKVDVAGSISELFFTHERVVLPDFGGFIAVEKPAAVDFVKGSVQPPARSLEFKRDLLLDDGALAEHLAEKYGLSAEQAAERVQAFVKDLKVKLERKEIVEIPKVGRLYLDFEKKVRFLPEGTNFKQEAFGLPTVQFYPVMRDRKDLLGKATPPLPAKPKPAPVASSNGGWRWLQPLVLVLLLLSALVMLASIFFLMQDEPLRQPEPPGIQDRLNTKPGRDQAGNLPLDDPEDLQDLESETASPSAGEPAPDVEAPTPAPNLKEVFIVLHSFGSTENAEKFAAQLFDDGYNAHSLRDGNLIRVGVLFTYERDVELRRMMDTFTQKYKTRPRIWPRK
ncbi:MAG: hypothetical protein D6765_02390 [Bacteroidetes bacterium]|nr:MAG: hypothetical protein D6765_02390 [Bacteroidota bacterium]